MEEAQWDIEEVKSWKKTQLLQYNLGMLLLFMLLLYFTDLGNIFVLIGIFYVIVLILAAITLYNLVTGRFIGTKTARRIQEFDRDRIGKKRWKRRKIAEAVFVVALTSLVTFLVFGVGTDNAGSNFSSMSFPFIGAWVGYNIGELFRISNLKE